MIKIMIVEDEPPILRNIKKIIEDINPEFHVIDCFRNGQLALNKIRKSQPDVLITDIHMPVMDGLELLEHLYNDYPDIITVILSGYQEFEYAKKALQFKVTDYLLKPLSIPKIEKVFSTIYDDIVKKRQEDEDMLISSLIDNHSVKKFNCQNIDYKMYTIVSVLAGPYPLVTEDELVPGKDYWEKINIKNFLLSNKCKIEKTWIFTGKTQAEKIIVFAFNKYKFEDFNNFIDSFFNKLNKGNLFITFISGTFINKIEDIPVLLKKINYLMNKRVYIENSTLIKLYLSEEDKKENNLWFNKLDTEINREIYEALLSFNKDDTSKLIKKLVDFFINNQFTQIEIAKYIKHIVISYLEEAGNNISWLKSVEDEVNLMLTHTVSYNELHKSLCSLFKDLMPLSHSSKEEDTILPIVKKFDDFITSNYNKKITNKMITKKFFLVPSYLSRLFKIYKGVTPSQYIKELRIKKAKELIKLNRHIYIKEISYAIGYSDPLYFSKIFHQETGLWPKEYKNKIYKS